MKKIILALILSLLLCGKVEGKPLSLSEIMEASCRVSVSNGIGSGTCIAKDGEYYIVLTNAHVVDRKTSASVEFFKYGYKTYKIPATVIKSWWTEDTDRDFALLGVHEKYVSQCPPRVIPLIPVGYEPENNYIYSAGCPEGKWLKAWEGRIEKNESTRFIFTPPPIGGQSGSGLMVLVKDKNGELQTRVGGIVTFRISDDNIFSDRMDNNGFELAKGAAIPISTLYKIIGYDKQTYQPTKFPPNYRLTAANCNICGRSSIDHAIGSDNKYYCVYISDGNLTCRAGPGVTILRWPPKGRIVPLPPILQPDNSTKPENGNPFGDNLPNILSPLDGNDTPEEVPDPILPSPASPNEDEIIRLQSIIDGLQQQIESLGAQLSSSSMQNSLISDQKIKLETELANKTAELEKYKQELEKLQATLDVTTTTLDKKDSDLSVLNDHLDNISNQLTEAELAKIEADKAKEAIAESATQAENDKEALKNQRNWLSGIAGTLGTGLFSSLAWMFWNRRGRKKAGDLVDKGQDLIDNRLDKILGEGVVTELHNWVDGLQEKIGERVDNAIRNHVPTVLDKIIEKKTEEIPVKKVVEEEVACPTQPKTANSSSRKSRRKNRSRPFNLNINNTNSNTNQYEERDFDLRYIKDFFKHKECDGERVENWAVMGVLYREAIDKLKRGELYFKANNKLQGQQETANRINDWVKQQFMFKMTKDMLKCDKMYIEAMLGFLYKEAVAKLKEGFFDVLGYQATAQAIESWVNTEFLKRVGINI